jgi:signal transduction histidine kinase
VQTKTHISLGALLTQKISVWILTLVIAVITAILLVSFSLSWQMFNKQVNTWNSIVPQQIVTNLMDSDHFTIKKEIQLLKSTKLFSSVIIIDNKKRMIAQFGKENESKLNVIPITDNAKIIWGYYYFKSDFYHFILPFIFAAILFFILTIAFYSIIQWQIKMSLEKEFMRFNNFLSEIESLTQRLHEVYNYDIDFQPNLSPSENTEQVIINLAITRLLEQIKKSNKSLREAISYAEQRRFQEELTRTALQVAHDIASPVAVLDIFHTTAGNLPEQDRILIRNVICRIRDISNTLLKKAKHDFALSGSERITKHTLYSLLAQIAIEKQMQYGDKANIVFEFDKKSYQIFSLIKSSEFSRLISNLINNSCDAIDSDNRIFLSLSESQENALIQIKDYGKGIPSYILNQVGQLGYTFGKTQGTGVGLNHAINTINDWAGCLEIESEEGNGTTIKIYLPKCKPPHWFISEIRVNENQLIVIIDDDESIHTIWERRFQRFQDETKMNFTLLHFNKPESLIEWHNKNSSDHRVLYLCDHEFTGSSIKGLDLIKKLHIAYSSILVTSTTDSTVFIQCESEQIKLLPKDIAGKRSILPIF